MSSVKVRIYDLARELGTPNKILIDTLKEKLNITVKSHSSTIDAKHAEKLKILLQGHNSNSSRKEEPKTSAKQIEEPKQTIQEATTKPEVKPTQEVQKPVYKEQAPPPRQEINKPKDTRQEQIHHKPIHNKPIKDSRPQENVLPYGQNKQQNTTDTPKKPTPTDRPYHVTGNKYKYRPDNKIKPGQKPEFRQGQKPGYKHGQKPGFRQKQDEQTTETQKVVSQEAVKETEIRQQPKEGTHTTQHTNAVQKEKTYQGKPGEHQHQHQHQRHQHQHQNQHPHQHPHQHQQQNQQNKEIKEGHQHKKHDDRDRDKDRGDRDKFPNKDKAAFKHKKPEGFAKSPSPEKTMGDNETTTNTQPAKHAKTKFFKKKETKNKFVESKPLEEILRKKKPKKEVAEIVKPTEILINTPLTIAELAERLHLSAAEIITELIKTGIFATLNETISEELGKDVSEKLGYTVLTEKPEESKEETEAKEEEQKTEKPEKVSKNRQERAPIVTILGHVDHGKTSLLDAIRKTKNNLVDDEVGGITQSIGAYTVERDGNKIVFVDTPGHQAFTAMRARGAQVTDIAILIIAADDGIMPQTVEAINHAKAAGVPIIVAINKIDKAGVDPDRVLQQLTEHNLIPEDWGGDTVTVKISAVKGQNIDELLDMISIVAELQELKADPTLPGTGVVVESELDKGKGAIARVLVQDGTLKVGDYVAVGSVGGKVRALLDDCGNRINEAGPSTPVEILGLSEVPTAGDSFEAVTDDKTLKQIIAKRKLEERNKRLGLSTPIKLQKDTMFKAKMKKDQPEVKDLNMIIKADTDGSAKAVEAALQELKSKEVTVKIIHSGVGDISEADVMLAATSNAIVIGFGVKEDQNAARVSAEENVSIRTYDIIYQISDDIEKTMLGLLAPEYKEIELGTAEVRDLFTVGKNTVIAGCYVLEGKVVRNKTATVFRNNKEIYRGPLDNLKRFKDDAKEVATGYECGISFNKFNDIEKGDLIKVTAMEEIERDSL
ncbi:MAG: translation initiation factor IF-2 [Vampirovibrionia bacterium]